MTVNFNYYYGNDAELYSFYRIPRILLVDEAYAELSTDAKILYGIIIDRMGMSQKNQWIDENNRIFVTYPIAEIQKDLNISRKKAMVHLGELEEYGLISKKVRGLGQPSLLYPMKFTC